MNGALPSARQLAWLLVQATSALDAVAAAVVARVEQDATASAVADLARRFYGARARVGRGLGRRLRAAMPQAELEGLDHYGEGLHRPSGRDVRLGVGR